MGNLIRQECHLHLMDYTKIVAARITLRKNYMVIIYICFALHLIRMVGQASVVLKEVPGEVRKNCGCVFIARIGWTP